MAKTLISMIIAFCGYSLLNIAQACQKIGLGVMERKRLVGTIIWIAATLATTVSSFVVLSAVSKGSVSLVGAMAGTGLASLSIFSVFVMRENIRARELAGIAVVLGAAVLIGLFSEEMGSETGPIKWLFIFLGGIASLGALSILVLSLRGKPTGTVVGCFAGALGGFIPLFQKISTSDMGRRSSLVKLAGGPKPYEQLANGGILRQAGEIFANPYSAAWIALSVLSMIVLQFALKKQKAIRIIPSYTSSQILLPVIGGVLFFSERLNAFQVAGVVLILGGVFLITVRRESPAPRES